MNEIMVDTNNFKRDNDDSPNLNSYKVHGKEFQELENKMQRAQTVNFLKTLYNFIYLLVF